MNSLKPKAVDVTPASTRPGLSDGDKKAILNSAKMIAECIENAVDNHETSPAKSAKYWAEAQKPYESVKTFAVKWHETIRRVVHEEVYNKIKSKNDAAVAAWDALQETNPSLAEELKHFGPMVTMPASEYVPPEIYTPKSWVENFLSRTLNGGSGNGREK